jgi:hypothetical protein
MTRVGRVGVPAIHCIPSDTALASVAKARVTVGTTNVKVRNQLRFVSLMTNLLEELKGHQTSKFMLS